MEINKETLKSLVPKGQKSNITDEFVKMLNTCATDTEVLEEFKENFVSYINVLQGGKYKMQSYLDAIRYVTYKLLGHSTIKAYEITFPERVRKLLARNADINPYAQMYNKNKLVMQIYEQTLTPSYIVNAPLFQEALNELAVIGFDRSHRNVTARVKALDSILAYTKQPELKNIQLDIGVNVNDEMKDMLNVLSEAAKSQREMIENGYSSAKDIVEATIISSKAIPEG